MTILERLEAEFKEAMKAKDEVKISTLRLVRTALKNKQIELQHSLTEPEIILVLKTMIKQYQDALADFRQGNRQDLIDRQQLEIDIIATYLPPPLPAAELERIVSEAVTAAGVKEVGKAIGIAMRAVDGRADGNEVRRIVERLLVG